VPDHALDQRRVIAAPSTARRPHDLRRVGRALIAAHDDGHLDHLRKALGVIEAFELDDDNGLRMNHALDDLGVAIDHDRPSTIRGKRRTRGPPQSSCPHVPPRSRDLSRHARGACTAGTACEVLTRASGSPSRAEKADVSTVDAGAADDAEGPRFLRQGSQRRPSSTGTTAPPTLIWVVWPRSPRSAMCTKLWRPIFVPCSLMIWTAAFASTRPWRIR
jgi:hypothetical protein